MSDEEKLALAIRAMPNTAAKAPPYQSDRPRNRRAATKKRLGGAMEEHGKGGNLGA